MILDKQNNVIPIPIPIQTDTNTRLFTIPDIPESLIHSLDNGIKDNSISYSKYKLEAIKFRINIGLPLFDI